MPSQIMTACLQHLKVVAPDLNPSIYKVHSNPSEAKHVDAVELLLMVSAAAIKSSLLSLLPNEHNLLVS